MKRVIKYLLAYTLFSTILFAQGFDINSRGEQTFYFKDDVRNQAVFFSEAPLESITGMSTNIDGEVTLDLSDLNTLSGKVTIPTESLKSGIDLRDEHLRSSNWLDAGKYKNVTFDIKSVKNIEKQSGNVITADVVGDFTLRDVTKEVTAKAKLTYLEESEATKSRVNRGGDLLGVTADFQFNLSDFGVDNDLVGSKVAEEIEVKVTMVGSNKKPE